MFPGDEEYTEVTWVQPPSPHRHRESRWWWWARWRTSGARSPREDLSGPPSSNCTNPEQLIIINQLIIIINGTYHDGRHHSSPRLHLNLSLHMLGVLCHNLSKGQSWASMLTLPEPGDNWDEGATASRHRHCPALLPETVNVSQWLLVEWEVERHMGHQWSARD